MRTIVNCKEDFLRNVPPAQAILDFVYEHACQGGVRWYFKECWADFESHAYDVEFQSFATPEYKDYSLQVSACLGVNGWTIREEHRTP